MTKLLTSPKDGAALRRKLMEEFKLESVAALVLVDTAAAALDEALAAEKIVAKEGLVANTSRGPKPHPAIHIAATARARMIRSLRALNLEL